LASTGTRQPRTGSDRFLPPDPRVESPYRFTPQLALRIGILGAVALAVFGVLFFRLWALQVLSAVGTPLARVPGVRALARAATGPLAGRTGQGPDESARRGAASSVRGRKARLAAAASANRFHGQTARQSSQP